jgi:hypothetical protein
VLSKRNRKLFKNGWIGRSEKLIEEMRREKGCNEECERKTGLRDPGEDRWDGFGWGLGAG